MNPHTQSRKWTLVINNPQECGLDHEKMAELLMKCNPVYFCMSDEIATTGTFHTHIFLYAHSPVRFGTIKGRFPTAHIEKANGSAVQNRDYIAKSGKWAEDEKAKTTVEGSFFEYGDLPEEHSKASSKMSRLIEEIKEGKRTAEIVNDSPGFGFRTREIESLRQTILSDEYTAKYRHLQVSYLFGATGTGKTKCIYHQHDPHDICRITNYRTARGISFDNYTRQDVLVFEEFHSQIPIGDMLNYLDIYPLSLPARYYDRVACYTKVYITSNLALSEQYKEIQLYHPEVWHAFLRRIHKVIEFRQDGTILEQTIEKKED